MMEAIRWAATPADTMMTLLIYEPRSEAPSHSNEIVHGPICSPR